MERKTVSHTVGTTKYPEFKKSLTAVKKMKSIQISINHLRVNQNLLPQATYKSEMQVLWEASLNAWKADLTDGTTLWALGDQNIPKYIGQPAHGFTWAKVGFYSRYVDPSFTLTEFEDILKKLVSSAKGWTSKVIDDDLNAWVTEWGNSLMKARRRYLLEPLPQVVIILANDGRVHTYGDMGDPRRSGWKWGAYQVGLWK